MARHQSKDRSTSNRINFWISLFLAFFVGVMITIPMATLGLPFLAEHIREVIVGAVVIIIVLGILVFLSILFRKEILQLLFGVTDTDISELKGSSKSLVESVLSRDSEKAKGDFENTFTKISAWYSWHQYKRWVLLAFQVLLVGFGGLLGSVLLFNQNKLFENQNALFQYQNERVKEQTDLASAQKELTEKELLLIERQLQFLKEQNEKIETQTGLFRNQNELIAFQNTRVDSQLVLFNAQNDKIEKQTYLIESQRRNSLIFELGNVLDAIKEETNYGKEKEISDQLIGRISALSRSFKPYRYLQGDSLSRELSPERGQLLIALLESNLKPEVLEKIYSKSDFTKSDLDGAKLRKCHLAKVDLSRSSLRSANLDSANLHSANLCCSDLSKANFGYSSMIGTELGSANAQGAYFSSADLSNAVLISANFKGAVMRGTKLHGAVVKDLEWLNKLIPHYPFDYYFEVNYRMDSLLLERDPTIPRWEYDEAVNVYEVNPEPLHGVFGTIDYLIQLKEQYKK